jgi:hypothetical protein
LTEMSWDEIEASAKDVDRSAPVRGGRGWVSTPIVVDEWIDTA